MAIADYFQKNAMAASQVLQHFENAGFEAILLKQCVAVAIDGKAATSREGAAATDLIVRLLARFYPRMAIIALDSKASSFAVEMAELASAINPKVTLSKKLSTATHCVVIGQTRVALTRRSARVFYIGSRGWTALLSGTKPVACGNSTNPFGAGVAACFGAANLFRVIFKKQLPQRATPYEDISFSILEFRTSKTAKPDALKSVPVGDACLVGAGAIGNGALWALRRVPMSGTLTLVDPQALELSNLQRYVLATRQDEYHTKVSLADRWFSGVKGVRFISKEMTWDEYARKSEWKFDRVAVALDNAKDRIGVQASLPRWIVNGWTLGSAIGISRHPNLDGDACLACLYLPDVVEPSEDFLIATSVGFATTPQHPELMDVRRRLELNVPNDRPYLERIAALKNVPVEKLLPFENKTLRTLYTEGVCGGQVLGLVVDGHDTQAEVPLPFQSAMAGILLGAELVIDALGARAESVPTISRLDLLGPFPDLISSRRAKDPNKRCLCQDDDYRAVYADKYGSSNVSGKQL